MELRSVVFNAARDGQLYRLKVFLDRKPKEEIAALVSSRTNGSTPLIIACRNGHLDVAYYLMEKCHADIEQVGSVTFDEETIEGATPLWCAAASGHLNVVKLLVRYKASVNSTTKTSSTPLRAACFDGHFEIAKYLIQEGADIEIANRHRHTCLMIACYKGHNEISKYLVQQGADINRKSLKGNTALHDCAESGNLEILKLLLEHGAKFDFDSYGTTPLLSAAINGHALIVEFFFEEFDCTKLEKVNALELLGATYIDKKGDMITALDCWKRAMQLRYEDADNPLEKPIIQSPLASYLDVWEFRTISDLENLRFDPDEMIMQALLVRERILGPGDPYTVYYIRYRGKIYADEGNFDGCIKLLMYALDVLQKVQEPLSEMTQTSFLHFAVLFSHMMSQALLPFAEEIPIVSFLDILHVFERALKEIETAMGLPEKQGRDSNYNGQFHNILRIAIHLVGLMCKLKPHLNESEELQLKKTVYQLVRMNPRTNNGWTPLHLACMKDSSSLSKHPILSFPCPEVVDLLLEVGACPNAVDVGNNTPLHISAIYTYQPFAQAVFKSLLKYGAHLDICNYEKQTPLQLAQDATSLDIYPLRYINLQCLCAQAIKTHNISFKGFVHKSLEVFLDGH